MIIVDVQRKECGEWYRAFGTMEEAERYLEHITKERGCIASIRREVLTKTDLVKERVHGRNL
jgi:hypothetical protein